MSRTPTASADSRHSLQAFLLLDVFVRLFIWSLSLTITATVMNRLNLWPSAPPWHATWAVYWEWSQAISLAILLFNIAYVAILVALRIPIPNPREGRYELRGRRIDLQLIRAAFAAIITKARYEAPFPAFLVHQVCSLPPMSWLVGPTLGPRSKSCNITQPIIGDPHLTALGRNVVIGYGASMASHVQDRDGVTIARTEIGDEVLVGAHALIYGGCRIGRGATILGGAVVKPFTEVGPNEVWGGVPAVKIKEMPAIEALSRN